MEEQIQDMCELSFIEHLLFILHKLNKLDKKLATRIKNKTFLLTSNEVI